MRRAVYHVLAAVDDKALGSFLLARDPDEAVSKAQRKLPEGGKVNHVLRVCVASLSEFNRNKLFGKLEIEDALEWSVDAIMHFNQIQRFQVEALSRTVLQLRDAMERMQKLQAEQGESHES